MPGDAVSLAELLDGFVLSGRTWCYADLGAQGGFSVPPGDGVHFHAVLHGAVRIASATGGMVEVRAGEAVAVLSGEAHALRVSPDAQAHPLDYLREEQSGDIPPTFALGKSGPAVARVLSGRLAAAFPAGTSRPSLPTYLRLGAAGQSAWGSLLASEALPLAGIGHGASVVLSRVVSLMLTAELRADPGLRELFMPRRQDPIGQALRLIAGNPSASWTVERLARSVGMGRSNFAAHFTSQVGRAPMEVVAEARMEQAAQLLRKGRLKIAEISELCGYGSEAAFSRRFTRHFGLSPSQMREAMRAEAPDQENDLAGTSWLPLLAGRRSKEAATRVRHRAAHHARKGAGSLLGGMIVMPRKD